MNKESTLKKSNLIILSKAAEKYRVCPFHGNIEDPRDMERVGNIKVFSTEKEALEYARYLMLSLPSEEGKGIYKLF